ncbi:unnamed protein product [Spodoptera littoralis]|uniref:ZAD domain-containing protein n=1 Tax=Spodoptera littoralis TaxID=7109 RepID=A0A9P0I0U7_SPOLI|nr:unnamed protein product [Spodoptera littoralis]CAH1637977.1 unnamed protein product [Spodoptera littoralis]
MNATEEIFMINAIPSSSQPSTSTQKLGELVLSGGPQVNLENVKDFSHVCRTCATITEFVIPIFAGEGLQNNLADKIHKHLPIQVCVEDRLPQVVCYQCSSTLLAWHELVQCCLHADTALRARLASDTLQEPKTSNVISNSIENEAQPKSLYIIVKSVLVDHFHNIVDEEDLDVEFVCQKCVDQPRLPTVRGLAQHIQREHGPGGSHTHDSVKTFITENITFEQALAPNDSDTEIQATAEKLKPQTDKNKKTSQAAAATLYCPYCPGVFSSATRLVHHLNKHVQVSMAAGVLCCDLLYHDKKLFVKHLQEAHIDRDDATREALIQVTCGSCGYITDHVDKLKNTAQVRMKR